MNINNFEEYINETILDRGYDYYIEGNIVEACVQGDNEYIFRVQGSEEYEVKVSVDKNGDIIYSDCDCPYDFGPICKHQVATYYELYNILNVESNNKDAAQQPEIEIVLNNLSKEKLINIIMDITKKDASLRNSIIFKYSQGDDTEELEKCKKLMESIVEKYISREGYITYRETHGFVSEMEDLLDKVRDTDDILLALDIAFLVLEESIDAFQYADDSNGEIGCLVSEIIGLIEVIIVDHDDLDTNLREEIFNKLLKKSDSKFLNGWQEYRIDMLRICSYFADIEEFRSRLRMKIEYLVNTSANDKYMKYSNESMLTILFRMIEEYGTKEEAEEFMKANLKFTYFRELFINKYIKEKNYCRVIDLTLEGEMKDKEYAGLVSKWKKIRYTAYKELLLKEEQERLAKELFINGDFEYYKELKELHKDDEEIFYNNIKEELKKHKGWRSRDMYIKLITLENDLAEIMGFVTKNPDFIEKYADRLVNKYQDQVMEIYERNIMLKASLSSKRKQYKEVCRMIMRYKKIAGKNRVEKVVNELIMSYKRRPAFVDELRKIK